jgi:uncharacterized NAD-dependent epimerase/dehydratase family protein
VLILCHDPTRLTIKGLPDFPILPLAVAAERYLQAARDTNPAVRLAGVSLNTAKLDALEREHVIAETEATIGVPCFDPIKSALDTVVTRILES